jgi:glutamate-1-semialdehyde 2,1-aminomutase
VSAGPESKAWFERALTALPGGVDSPVRAFGAVGGEPLVIASAAGHTITDVDGRDYLDFVNSWGPLILGHAHPAVIEAIETTARRGTSYGAPCRPEIELAEKVVELYPGIEQVRFVSSGTEAVMSAIRLARGATGRKLIVKFEGCYHGHVDHMLVAAGSGLVTLGQPSSAGVPPEFTELTRVLPLDDDAALDRLFAHEGDQIAAVIIEPVPANNGLLLQRPEFLQSLRDYCDRDGALLIFDEVITGFRLGPGGAAAHYNIQPDLATFGKVIGGGMPVGAFAGSAALMAELSPTGSVYQAGTLSGNPVAMAAGLATLATLEREDGWTRLEALGRHLETELNEVIDAAGVEAAVARIGSIFWLALGSRELPRAAGAIDADAGARYAPIFRALLEQGIALAPSAYEVGFISLLHSIPDLDRLAASLQQVFANS